MKKMTQEEFDRLPLVGGMRQCPGNIDYSAITFFERCSFGEGCIAHSPYWSFVYSPPFKTKGKIYPPITTRKYWEERLGLSLDGCYKEIGEKIKPELDNLLKLDKWTSCERRILESWR